MFAEDLEDFVEKEYSVPDDLAGLIIGRGGAQIKRLETETGCRIKVASRRHGDPNRRCTLSGSRESVRAAKSMIKQIIRQSEPYVKEIMIPGPDIGRLIGKGGVNLKQLQEKCGVNMTVIQEGPEPTIYSKPLRISGDQEHVEYAEQMVEDFLAERDTEQTYDEFRAARIVKKSSQRVFASQPVYRDNMPFNKEQYSMPFNQEQDNSICTWFAIGGLAIFLLIICSPWFIVVLLFLLLMVYITSKKN